MKELACNNKQHGHPCFDVESHHSVGRIHLPVAPRCNIKCKYCSRKFDCANENRPGVTSKVMGPEEAIARVDQAISDEPRINSYCSSIWMSQYLLHHPSKRHSLKATNLQIAEWFVFPLWSNILCKGLSIPFEEPSSSELELMTFYW